MADNKKKPQAKKVDENAQVKKQVYDLNEIEKKRKRDLATGKMRTRRWKRNG